MKLPLLTVENDLTAEEVADLRRTREHPRSGWCKEGTLRCVLISYFHLDPQPANAIISTLKQTDTEWIYVSIREQQGPLSTRFILEAELRSSSAA